MNETMRVLGVLGAVAFAAGCGGSEFPGTYRGDVVESGTLRIAVLTTDDVAINEIAPREAKDQTVTVVKDGKNLVVKLGHCSLKGEHAGGRSVVLADDCKVEMAGVEGPLPLSGIMRLEDGKMWIEVTGQAKNATASVKYGYRFEGKSVQ